MLENSRTKTRTPAQTPVREMLWMLLRDRIEQDAREQASRTISYTRSNRVPGAGE